MSRLTPHEITVLFVALGTLLGAARLCGELAKRLKQPSVLGEILAGVLLGPTVFGRIAPDLAAGIFPRTGGGAIFLDGFVTVAAALFLLVAGLEVELGRVWRQGRAAIYVSFWGIAIPFALGLVSASIAPRAMGSEVGADPVIFALFFATALSISALPVIARTLLDLNLFRTDIGMIIVAAAIVQDLLGWIIFAVILGMMGSSGGHGLPIGATIALTLGFAAVMLTVVRMLVHRAMPWIQAHASWPGGVLGFCLCVALFCAAFTEWIGVHAIFGTFMAGVAIGDSSHLRERTRSTLDQFISFIFAPLFFASVGLKVDFVTTFDPVLVVTVLLIACAGKILGAGLGARLSGMGKKESLAVGYGMNARGAMEIVLGLLALEAGVISERMFVALVIMALVTSMMSGPLIQRALGGSKGYHLRDLLHAKAFVPALRATTSEDAIRELALAAAPATGTEGQWLAQAVVDRERILASGLERGLAIPSARLDPIKQPLVAIGLSRHGLDFNAPDGTLAHVVCLVLIPGADHDAQWGIMAEIGRALGAEEVRDRVLQAASYVELLAALNWGEGHGAGEGPRRGLILVGAGHVGRALGKKLAALGAPVWVVDSNRDHCLAAQRDGLNVVQGSALRDVILFQAHAFEARAVLALTPNAEVNGRVVRLAREAFRVPQGLALTDEAEASGEFERIALANPAALAGWDRWVNEGAADWASATVARGDPTGLAEFVAIRGGRDLLPLVVIREKAPVPVHARLELAPGDELLGLRRRHASLSPLERVERAADRALVLALDAPASPLEAAARAAQALAQRLGPGVGMAPPSDERALTPLTPWLRVGRLRCPRPETLELAVVRSPATVAVAPGAAAPAGGGEPSALVLIASSEDEYSTHLHALATIARCVEEDDAVARWAEARTPEAIRAALLAQASAPALAAAAT